jgi:hypothetical protein
MSRPESRRRLPPVPGAGALGHVNDLPLNVLRHAVPVQDDQHLAGDAREVGF